MRRIVFLTVILAAGPVVAQDWEGDLLGGNGTVSAMFGVEWGAKYIWRGFDVYDDVSATHILADLNVSGFGVAAAGHRANSSGFENRERWDYTLYYQNAAFPGEDYATNFRVGWVYYNYPELNEGESTDLQEGQLLLSWPNLLPVKGLCPSYVLVKLWPSYSGSPLPDSASGWMHILMLDYGLTVPSVMPELFADHVIKLHSELVYNDGVTPAVWPRNPDHDWSHAVFGVSTDLAFGPDSNLIFTPAVYYQSTFNDTVNPDSSELWGSFTLKYTF